MFHIVEPWHLVPASLVHTAPTVLWLALPPLAAAGYLVAGQWLFRKRGRATYQHALTALPAVFVLLPVTR